MTQKLRLTPSDLERLEHDIHRAEERVVSAQADRNESLDGEEMHENSAFELADSQLSMWRHQLGELRAMRANAEVVQPVADGQIGLGSVVTCENLTDQSKHCFRIVGYGGGGMGDDVRDISEGAPLARLMLGKRIGDHVIGQIGVKAIEFTVVDVM